MDLNPGLIRVEKISLPVFTNQDLEVFVLRLDLIHPEISGNKWFKLRFYLEEAKLTGKTHLLSFGGAWSNHILATAAAASLAGFSSTAIIRGEEKREPNAMLAQAKSLGMKLIFVSREDYKQKRVPGEAFTESTLLIPEGGAGPPGIKGAATILDHCDKNEFRYIICASGTGTMASGLKSAISPGQEVIPVSVLKGFGKIRLPVIRFMNEFYRLTGIPTDFIYTAPLFLKTIELASAGYFSAGSKLLIIHSGGLQGNRSLPEGTLIF